VSQGQRKCYSLPMIMKIKVKKLKQREGILRSNVPKLNRMYLAVENFINIEQLRKVLVDDDVCNINLHMENLHTIILQVFKHLTGRKFIIRTGADVNSCRRHRVSLH